MFIFDGPIVNKLLFALFVIIPFWETKNIIWTENIMLLCFSWIFFKLSSKGWFIWDVSSFFVHFGSSAIHSIPSDCDLRKGLLNMRFVFYCLTSELYIKRCDVLWPDPMPKVPLGSTNVSSWSLVPWFYTS